MHLKSAYAYYEEEENQKQSSKWKAEKETIFLKNNLRIKKPFIGAGMR